MFQTSTLLITIGGLGTYTHLICFVKVDSVQFLHSFRTIGTWIWQSFWLLYTIDSTGYICIYITFLFKTKIELWFGTLMLFFVDFCRNGLLERLNFGIATLRHSQFCPVELLTSTLAEPGRIDPNPVLTSSKNNIGLSTQYTPKGLADL